jgi:hypothetical protein
MKKFALAVAAAAAVVTPLAVAGAPANAATSTTSVTGAPTMAASNVAKGRTIPVHVNSKGSKVRSKTNTLWQHGHRIRDWSPKPGTYKVKSVIKYRPVISTRIKTWHADEYCYGDWDENGEWDDNLDCVDDGWWTWKTTKTLGAKKTVTRYDYAKVAADETPGCVSGSEFRQVKDGMTQKQVARIFGTSGWVTSSGSGGTHREYTTCEGDQDWSYVSVDFDPGVWFKWRYVDWT